MAAYIAVRRSHEEFRDQWTGADGSGSKYYLEGDERVYVDNCLTPALYGTGTEDTFNGGWYYKYGTFTLPTHGFTWWDSPERRAQYRLLVGDMIPYSQHIKFGMEHGGNNDLSGANMTCAVYYYASPVGSSLFQTDTLDVGATSSESAHGYVVSAASVVNYSYNDRYEGDNDNLYVSDSGRHFTNGYSEFTLAIEPANYGVRLRRMMYYGVADQNASVHVDDQAVGQWFDAGSNNIIRWRESEFDIPACYTQGKSSIRVRIGTTGQWTEYEYYAFSFRSPTTTDHTPTVADEGAYTPSLDTLRFTWEPPNEPVWGITAYSYAVGTTPGGTEVRGWTDAGVSTSVVATGLSLEEGKTYYASVKARNGAGVWSVPGVSDGIAVAVGVPSIAAARALLDGTRLALRDLTVTAVFDGAFYLQDASRASGIRVVSVYPAALGEVLDVEGVLATADGERHLVAGTVIEASPRDGAGT